MNLDQLVIIETTPLEKVTEYVKGKIDEESKDKFILMSLSVTPINKERDLIVSMIFHKST